MFPWKVQYNETESTTVQAENGYEAANAWLEQRIRAGEWKPNRRYFISVTRLPLSSRMRIQKFPTYVYSVIAASVYHLTAAPAGAERWQEESDSEPEPEFVYHSRQAG